jgi:glycerate kinase
MKLLLAFDKFKDSMTSKEANTIASDVLSHTLRGSISVAQLSDGGEGFIEAIASNLSGTLNEATVHGPLGDKVKARFYFCHLPGRTQLCAAIELAQTSGLQLLPLNQRDVWRTNTRGLGEMIEHVIQSGAQEILIGLGGSATHDLGLGALQALQLVKSPVQICPNEPHFEVDQNKELVPLTFVTDVKAPILGKYGSAYTFSRQKGNPSERVQELENVTLNWERQLNSVHPNESFRDELGMGAAGGIAFGFSHFAHTELMDSTTFITDVLLLEEKVVECDLVITGEGRLDESSLMGKAPYVLYELAKKHQKKVIYICGAAEESVKENLESDDCEVFELIDHSLNLEENLRRGPQTLRILLEEISHS